MKINWTCPICHREFGDAAEALSISDPRTVFSFHLNLHAKNAKHDLITALHDEYQKDKEKLPRSICEAYESFVKTVTMVEEGAKVIGDSHV